MNNFLFVILGFAAGSISGLIGIGGGIFMVPALVLLFNFSQQRAEGTTLAAMVPPIGALAAYIYYRSGFVDLKGSALIAAGFLLGGFLGAQVATSVNPDLLRRIFGGFTLLIGLRMLWGN